MTLTNEIMDLTSGHHHEKLPGNLILQCLLKLLVILVLRIKKNLKVKCEQRTFTLVKGNEQKYSFRNMYVNIVTIKLP